MPPIWMRMPPRDGEAGITLAEMLVVLAILAMVSGLVVGRGLPGQGGLRQAALEALVREVRGRAMVQGHPERLDAADPGLVALGGLVRVEPEGGILFQPDGSSAGGRVVVLPRGAADYGVEVAPITGRIGPWHG